MKLEASGSGSTVVGPGTAARRRTNARSWAGLARTGSWTGLARPATLSPSLVALALLVALAAVPPAPAQEVRPVGEPEIRFHVGGEELLPIAYPERYGDAGALRDDVAWVGEHSGDLTGQWEREGPTFLRRVTDLVGLEWPYRTVDVYLVRYWPVVSIEHPLVLALDAIRSANGVVDLPEDDDTRVLLLAHQVVHYLLDVPEFVPPAERAAAYDHPLLRPGAFELEAMVNWVTYEALADVWGAERLERATSTDLWRGYNPNHAFVTRELMERWSLSRMRTLREWLAAHPEESEIFTVADRYRREAGIAEPSREAVDRENLSGTEHGIDLGETYDGEVFVAYVDEGSPAARAGLLRGDVLSTVEGREVEDVVEGQRAIDESWRRNEEVNLSVRRGEREVFVTVGS